MVVILAESWAKVVSGAVCIMVLLSVAAVCWPPFLVLGFFQDCFLELGSWILDMNLRWLKDPGSRQN